jgi:hypothetical protein
MTNCAVLADRLEAALGVTEAVGVGIISGEAEAAPGDTAEASCVHWSSVLTSGRARRTAASDHAGCSVGSYVHGMWTLAGRPPTAAAPGMQVAARRPSLSRRLRRRPGPRRASRQGAGSLLRRRPRAGTVVRSPRATRPGRRWTTPRDVARHEARPSAPGRRERAASAAPPRPSAAAGARTPPRTSVHHRPLGTRTTGGAATRPVRDAPARPGGRSGA